MGKVLIKNENWKVNQIHIENNKEEAQLSISPIESKFINKMKEKKFEKVLDLGCGRGRLSTYLAKEQFQVYATDKSDKAINHLQEKVTKDRLNNMKIFKYDFANLGFEDEIFDAVICRSTLHHARLSKIAKGIEEVFRVLKQGGYFLFDMLSKEDRSYGLGRYVEDDTYVGSRKGEEGIIHHYTDLEELKRILKKFSKVVFYKNEYRIKNLGEDYHSKNIDVISIK